MGRKVPQPLTNSIKKRKSRLGLLLYQLHYINSASNALKIDDCNTHNDSTQDFKVLCKQGLLKDSLEILHIMDHCVDSSSYQTILHACIKERALPEGKVVHAHMNMRGFMSEKSVVNTLVDMYGKCGSLHDARKVFDKMPERNLFSWTAMIASYCRYGLAEKALNLFDQMRLAGVEPDGFVFATALQACGKLSALERGKDLHQEIVRKEFDIDVVVGNALLSMYAKCGSVEDAYDVFDKMPQRTVVSWTAMIGGFVQNGHADKALELYRQMRIARMRPDAMTYASVLQACSSPETLDQGKEIHEEIIRSGFQCNVIVGSTLVDMYVKCGELEDARQVFDKMPKKNVVSWTAMIAGYVQNGCADEALGLFHTLRSEGLKLDPKTFASVLPACAIRADLQQGMEIHEEIIQNGFQGDLAVCSALMDMYAKCGNVEMARELFGNMSSRDVVSWNTMIAAYSRDGLFEEALTLFHQMHREGFRHNQVTFASVLPACAKLTALRKGMEIHGKIVRSGLHPNSFVENALIDMYAKCGSIEDAHCLFERMHHHNLVSWNGMIGGYAMHGRGREALKLFGLMQKSGVTPDRVTFLCILSACCHAGLVKEGQQCFDCMCQIYHITPTIKHYCSMVDLLGRAGHLDVAEDFINKMPVQPDVNVWRSLLGACRIHNNIDIGERVAERLFELDPKDSASYFLLASIYAAASRWDDVEKVRKTMKDRKVEKAPGCSWIEINKETLTFLVGDKADPETEKSNKDL